MSSQNTFSIYMMKKDATLIKQANIIETKTNIKPYSIYNINLHNLPVHVTHMKEYLQELFELMMKYEIDYPYNSEEIYQTKMYKFDLNQNGMSEYVKGLIFHRVLMRKGSYYYVLQQSDRGVRFLLYAMDRVHHSSIALGYSMILPTLSEELKAMRDKLHNFTVKQVEELQIDNFNELIMKDELFFL